MSFIKQLPPNVVNKIAAGEVIERPASVVKELLENSVDAGATRIDVSIAKGGTELIRVSDNGCGVVADEMHLAVASHATSKIEDADDLFRVDSFGFRGEALASIAAVSQLVMRSRTLESDAGHEMGVDGGSIRGPAPCGCPEGTTVEIRHLFFNTPVRKKFMRTTQTEMGHISEAFTRIALAHPQIHFTLRHNDRAVQELPATESWRERIVTFFGSELDGGLIRVDSDDGEVLLSGYAADPSFSRGNNRMQYLFLNGRHIRDRSLQHALSEAYRGLLLTGRFPICFLRLEMPPHTVDVNVHPAKLEVRFQDAGRIYSQLLGTLRQKFLTTDLTARVQSPVAVLDEGPQSAVEPKQAEQHRRELVDWAKGESTKETDPDRGQTDLGLRVDGLKRDEWDRRSADLGPLPSSPQAVAAEEDSLAQAQQTPSSAVTRDDAAVAYPGALQVHNRYVITEDETGMVVIDQHALHERILYEQIREKVLGGQMETQRLLVPEPVTLTAPEVAAALDAKDLLSQLGIEIEPFGGDTILVSSYPAMLANLSPAEILRQIVEELVSGGSQPDRRDLLDELFHMISCKAAIKAGDRLTPEEIEVLLEHRELCQDAHHCPHGRPTALVFTREELDRRFKRT